MNLEKLSAAMSEVTARESAGNGGVAELIAEVEERLQLLREVKRLQARGGNGAPRIKRERKARKGRPAPETVEAPA